MFFWAIVTEYIHSAKWYVWRRCSTNLQKTTGQRSSEVGHIYELIFFYLVALE